MISIIRNNPRGDQVLSQKIYFVAMKFLVCLILIVRESVLKYFFNITQHRMITISQYFTNEIKNINVNNDNLSLLCNMYMLLLAFHICEIMPDVNPAPKS